MEHIAIPKIRVMTLEQILKSREARVARQRELLEAGSGLTLVCLTVQPPGPVKRSEASLVVAEAGVEAVRKSFRVEIEELRDLETGFEAFFMVDLAPLETKRISCTIEDTHPLGRLMDIDAIVPAGAAVDSAQSRGGAKESDISDAAEGMVRPLSREEIGLEPRKCLLCDRPARECMRARTHSIQELLEKYKEIDDVYLKS